MYCVRAKGDVESVDSCHFYSSKKNQNCQFQIFFPPKFLFPLGVKQRNPQQKLSTCKRSCKEKTSKGKRRRGYKTRETIGLHPGL